LKVEAVINSSKKVVVSTQARGDDGWRMSGAVSAVLLVAGCLSAASAQTPQNTESPAATAPTSETEGLLPEPGFLDRAIRYARQKAGSTDSGQIKNGFYPELSNMVTGAGWLTLGPGYRHWLGDGAFVDGSTAISWRAYKMAQVRLEMPRLARERLTIGTQYRWQDLTQITYFGAGAEAEEADRSEYRLKSHDIVGYATLRATDVVSVGTRIGWLGRPAIGAPTGSFLRGNPDTRAMFPDDVVYSSGEQPAFVHAEVFALADSRDHRSHATSGGVYRGSWATYRDQGAGLFTFRRFEAEGAQFLPVAGSRLVVALRGWLVATDTGTGSVVPFYMLPSLGGNNTIRSFTDYRFHDRNLILANAEARLAVFTHLDGVVFVDAGNVAPRLGDLNFDKRAYGFGVRLHTDRSTFVRFDVAHGVEGWQFVFRLNDPLHLTRLSRRTAALPFVP
jgi:hypothetical protein